MKKNLESYRHGHSEFRDLPIDQLFVDMTYQRELRDTRVKELLRDFNPDSFEPVTVNERRPEAGHAPVFALVDGQHRKAVAQALGMKTITCRIIHIPQADEPDKWIELNEGRRSPTPRDKFKANVAGKNTAAMEIARLLASRNLSVARNDDTESIVSVGTLHKVYSRGGYVRLARLLDTIRASWPEYESGRFMGTLMLGIDEYLNASPPNGLVTSLPEKLARTTPQQIMAKASSRWHGHRALGHQDKSLVDCVAEQVDIVYRARRGALK